jgi:hypothetical protein
MTQDLKEKNDHQGNGGKYTFSHVGRSRDLACNYLTKNRWSKKDITFICRMIAKESQKKGVTH